MLLLCPPNAVLLPALDSVSQPAAASWIAPVPWFHHFAPYPSLNSHLPLLIDYPQWVLHLAAFHCCIVACTMTSGQD